MKSGLMEDTQIDTAVADFTKGPTADDKYNEGVELSNACREFYHNRQRAADEVKVKLSSVHKPDSKNENTTKIHEAMEILRNEMATLMDLDLSLMKQLLTMNDTIEELKYQRDFMYRHSSTSTSLNLSDSDLSVSDTDMFGSEDDLFEKCTLSCDVSKTDAISNNENVVFFGKGVQHTDLPQKFTVASNNVLNEHTMFDYGR